MKVIAVQRDEVFSPNSVAKDKAILQAVCDRLALRHGLSISMITEKELTAGHHADVFLSMARGRMALNLLQEKEKQGALVLNSAFGVDRCDRGGLQELMINNGIPVPPTDGPDGFWIKRADQSAQSKADVVYCNDRAALASMQASFVERGVTKWVVQAHVAGDLVKFYGVKGGFFHIYYPGDDGISKFGDEALNGVPRHYEFDKAQLEAAADLLSTLTDVAVYGGDAIIDAHGNFYIIDFNDWPSFSRCVSEAAEAICELVERS
ncbi:hypothetical protein [Prevotella sp.]|uniref:hypothetical protein n=1 Tax=Prevotella sp. TaxID=59823 RepID=UPI002F952C4D